MASLARLAALRLCTWGSSRQQWLQMLEILAQTVVVAVIRLLLVRELRGPMFEAASAWPASVAVFIVGHLSGKYLLIEYNKFGFYKSTK